MELVKKNIHMNKIKCATVMQMTLDDDFNVPDVKPDVEKIIREQAQIKLNDYKLINQKLMVSGVMEFNVLYISSEDGRLIHSLDGKIPFEDVVNMENAQADDMVKISYTLDDLTATMVNSRKISIRSIISFDCIAENVYDEEAAVEIIDDESEGIESISKNVTVTQIAVNKKDIYRIREDVALPSSKQNIMEILYSDTSVSGVETRLEDGGVNLKGELQLFVMYTSENGDTQFLEKDIPFSGMVEVDGCNADMIDDIRIVMTSKDLSVKADTDGEERILVLEAVLSLDMKLYEEEDITMIKDFYSTKKNLTPIITEGYYDNILLKNNSKVRVTDRVKVDEKEPVVLQLCNSSAVVRIDDMVIVDDGINVEGVVDISLMYVTNDDMVPVNSINGLIPFSQQIEVKGIKEDCIYSIRPSIEHCSVMMSDGREFEVKVSISLEAIVFDRRKENVIREYSIEDIVPQEDDVSMIGYVVRENDNLWELAKRYRTTRECIKTMNFMEKEDVEPGDRILIVKDAVM